MLTSRHAIRAAARADHPMAGTVAAFEQARESCRHYRGMINVWNGKRSVWECSRCGTLQGRDQLHDAMDAAGDLRGVAGPLPERGWD